MRISILQFFVVYLILLASCSSKDHEKNMLYQSFNSELDNMRQVVKNSTMEQLADLESKRSFPSTQYKAEMWYPKAVSIHNLSDSLISQIEVLVNKLKPNNITDENEKEEAQLKNINASSKISQNELATLFDNLFVYRNNILKVNDVIKKEFENNLVIFPTTEEKNEPDRQEFANHYFKELSGEEAVLMLKHLENNIRYNENRMITFCKEQVGTIGWYMFSSYAGIIGQSSTVIKKGEAIEIKAGVGNFSKPGSSVITIDGKTIQPDANGIIRHKPAQNESVGKKEVNVRIDFIDQEGNKWSVQKLVQYVVEDN
jgi:hypothetical protein